MNYDLKNYLKIYKNVFDISFCQETIKQLDDHPWERHSYHIPVKQTVESFDKDFLVSYSHSPSVQILTKGLWNVIHKYINSYDFKWFTSWNGYIPIRINRYETGTQMKLHCDHIHTMFDGKRKGIPTLSVLGALNDDYEGGELIFWDEEKVELKAGDVMVFPSNFLYPHEVKEVTSGTRYSYISWVF